MKRVFTLRMALALAWAMVGVRVVHAQNAGVEFFEKKIRPALVEHCYRCHGTNLKKIRGGLALDTRAGWVKGGDSGPAVVPGHPDKSLLIQAIRFTDHVSNMPPKGKLPATVIADFEAWVAMGAPDPRTSVPKAKTGGSWQEIAQARADWWSLKPVKDPPLPPVTVPRPGATAIDRFLSARLQEKRLSPAEPAPATTLLRRLALVLTGLPPTSTELSEFERAAQEKRSHAIEQTVDRLLASPHFGERWARHWMDVVRFSETHGNEWNYEVHHAWRYRDYLIRAFNDDVPYDQFVREHLAGDLLEKPRWNPKERFNESVIGTAFYRFGEVNHDDCISLRQIGYDLADNQIDTLAKAFQAMTLACARCHEHKFDGVSMHDYYGVLGIIRSSRQVAHTIDHPDVNADVLAAMQKKKDQIRGQLAELWRKQLTDDRGSVLKSLVDWKEEKVQGESALDLLTRLASVQKSEKLSFTQAWKKSSAAILKEAAEHADFNRKNFETIADFRTGGWPDWQRTGQGLRGGPSRDGDFAIAAEGDGALAMVLPAGAYSHAHSEKLNGTLRSPVLATKKKHISFRVAGERRSAVRLVSNNCQLNYQNFRALMSPDFHWITFTVPEDLDSLRVYGEVMTMFDNPKFPDQLGQLGGDKINDRIPWEKAAANPRSFFGVTEVVLHDQPTPPKAEWTAVASWLKNVSPNSAEELAERVVARVVEACERWRTHQANREDVDWLHAFLKKGLLKNRKDLSHELDSLVDEYRKLDGQLSMPRIVPGLADFGAGFDQPMFARGDCFRPGDKAPRRFVDILATKVNVKQGSGRRELAEAIANANNPLTARVMVNRVWHHLFGIGLVRTVDDFGHLGETPSHPELLDYLASRFVENGWSVKKLIREIVLSHAFQQSHTPSEASLERDPENRTFQHYPARRMEAETIRDSVLATSGRLNRRLFGMSIPSYRDKDNDYRRLFKGPLDGEGRRSLYIKATLMEAPKFLEAFDLPSGKFTQGRRDLTQVPGQALAMLNDPFVLDQAQRWGELLAKSPPADAKDRVSAMFRSALGRTPTQDERSRFTHFVEELAGAQNIPSQEIPRSANLWRDVAHALFNTQEFITIP